MCGADHAIKYKHYNTERLSKEEIVVIRKGYENITQLQNPDKTKAHLFHVPEEVMDGLSSTELREKKKKGDTPGCLTLTFPAVLDYWNSIEKNTEP